MNEIVGLLKNMAWLTNNFVSHNERDAQPFDNQKKDVLVKSERAKLSEMYINLI